MTDERLPPPSAAAHGVDLPLATSGAEPAVLTAHARANRAAWNRDSDEYQGLHGDQLRGSGGLAWGIWQVPEAELGILGDVAGLDILELGCGAARLVHDYFGMHRFVEDEYYVEFMLPYGEWIRLFRRNGLAIDDLVEIRPPADASSTYTMDAGFEWARRWPYEHVWKLRKEG